MPKNTEKIRAYYDARIWIYRTKKLMEKLLGVECFSSWPAYQQKYGAQEYALGVGQPFTTPTPVAFCEEFLDPEAWEWRVFSPDHQDLKVFKPCASLDDAWVFVQALAKQEDVERDGFHTQDIFFARIRSSVRTTIGKTSDDPLTLQEIATLTPLDVCEAVWRAFQHIIGDSDRLPVPKTQNRQPGETRNC